MKTVKNTDEQTHALRSAANYVNVYKRDLGKGKKKETTLPQMPKTPAGHFRCNGIDPHPNLGTGLYTTWWFYKVIWDPNDEDVIRQFMFSVVLNLNDAEFDPAKYAQSPISKDITNKIKGVYALKPNQQLLVSHYDSDWFNDAGEIKVRLIHNNPMQNPKHVNEIFTMKKLLVPWNADNEDFEIMAYYNYPFARNVYVDPKLMPGFLGNTAILKWPYLRFKFQKDAPVYWRKLNANYQKALPGTLLTPIEPIPLKKEKEKEQEQERKEFYLNPALIETFQNAIFTNPDTAAAFTWGPGAHVHE